MNGFVKYVGVLVLLIGVVVLAVPAFTSGISNPNPLLAVGLGLVLIGYLGHIIINKKVD